MSKIVIDLGGLDKPDEFSLGIKSYLNKKNDIHLAVIGDKRDLSLLEGMPNVTLMVARKSLADYQNLSESLDDLNCSFSLAIKTMREWDGDILISFEANRRIYKSLPLFVKQLEFLAAPTMIGFIATRHRPVAISDWGLNTSPSLDEINEFYDLVLLTAKLINKPRKLITQRAKLLPHIGSDKQDELDPKIGILQQDLDNEIPWAMELFNELQLAPRDEFVGGVDLDKLFMGDTIDALISVGSEGEILSGASNSFLDAYISLLNLNSARSPKAGFGFSLCRKAIDETRSIMDNRNLGYSRLLLGYEFPIVFVTDTTYKSVGNALNIANTAANEKLQSAIFNLYHHNEPHHPDQAEISKSFDELVHRFGLNDEQSASLPEKKESIPLGGLKPTNGD